jgi:hypothetical protein
MRKTARLFALILSYWPSSLDWVWDSARSVSDDLRHYAEYGHGRYASGAVFYRA